MESTEINQVDSSGTEIEASKESESIEKNEKSPQHEEKSIEGRHAEKVIEKDENSNDSIIIQETKPDVIEIESSDEDTDVEKIENHKRKAERETPVQPKRIKVLNFELQDPEKKVNKLPDLLLANKPLAFGEFGFKFMEDEEDSNSNFKDSPSNTTFRIINNSENSFDRCEILDAESNSPSMLQQKSTFSCEICQKEVVSRYNLKRHMMIHTNQKPYACEICNRKFREASDMRKHKNVHVTGNRIFECQRCNRSFSTYKADKCYFCEEEEEAQGFNIMQPKQTIPIIESSCSLGETVRQSNAQNAFRCLMCGKVVLSDLELQLHVEIYHFSKQNKSSSTSSSPIQQASPENSGAENSPAGTEDEDLMEKKFKCTHCTKKFRSDLFCQMHIAQHVKSST